MTQPTPTPAPTPTPSPEPQPAPQPEPTPLPIPTPDLTSTSWWEWALTTVVSLAVAVGVIIGRPFNSVLIDGMIPTAALIAASIATAFQVHGAHKVAIARLQYQQEIRIAQIQANAYQITNLPPAALPGRLTTS